MIPRLGSRFKSLPFESPRKRVSRRRNGIQNANREKRGIRGFPSFFVPLSLYASLTRLCETRPIISSAATSDFLFAVFRGDSDDYPLNKLNRQLGSIFRRSETLATCGIDGCSWRAHLPCNFQLDPSNVTRQPAPIKGAKFFN